MDDDSLIVEVPGYGTLTERQKRFAERYREHGNGTRAAREAGFSGDADALGAAASRLLRNPKVGWYLAFLGRNDELTEGDVTNRLRELAFTSDHAGAAVRATELLGKARGMFADTINVHHSSPDEEIAQAIAGDDPALKALILKRLRGE